MKHLMILPAMMMVTMLSTTFGARTRGYGHMYGSEHHRLPMEEQSIGG